MLSGLLCHRYNLASLLTLTWRVVHQPPWWHPQKAWFGQEVSFYLDRSVEVHLVILLCSCSSVVLFHNPGISLSRNTFFRSSPRLCFVIGCFDRAHCFFSTLSPLLIHLVHADQTTNWMFWTLQMIKARIASSKTDLSPSPTTYYITNQGGTSLLFSGSSWFRPLMWVVLKLTQLTDHLPGKALFVQFAVRAFVGCCQFMCVLIPMVGLWTTNGIYLGNKVDAVYYMEEFSFWGVGVYCLCERCRLTLRQKEARRALCRFGEGFAGVYMYTSIKFHSKLCFYSTIHRQTVQHGNQWVPIRL